MSALAPAAQATYPGTIDGWRSWRILSYQTLDGEQSYRLCASGTRGLPKVWEPRKATVGVCSAFASGHAAPWPECECGIHAYRDEKPARRHLRTFVEGNGESVAGWAFGRVHLWGRIVECEHGWRAECGYPGALTVYAPAAVAKAIRSLYWIDVESAPPFVPEDEEEEGKRAAPPLNTPEVLRDIARAMLEINKGLDALGRRLATPESRPVARWRQLSWAVTHEQAVAALRAAMTTSCDGVASSREVAKVLAEPKDSDLPLAESAVAATALLLSKAATVGAVVKLRRAGRYGTCRWTLADRPATIPAGWEAVPDKHASFDQQVLEAFKQTLEATGQESARTRDILPHYGEPEATLGTKVRIAQALARLELRGQVRSLGGRPIEVWVLA